MGWSLHSGSRRGCRPIRDPGAHHPVGHHPALHRGGAGRTAQELRAPRMSRTDGLVIAVPSGRTTVGTVWFPPLTRSTMAAASGSDLDVDLGVGDAGALQRVLEPDAVPAPRGGVHRDGRGHAALPVTCGRTGPNWLRRGPPDRAVPVEPALPEGDREGVDRPAQRLQVSRQQDRLHRAVGEPGEAPPASRGASLRPRSPAASR